MLFPFPSVENNWSILVSPQKKNHYRRCIGLPLEKIAAVLLKTRKKSQPSRPHSTMHL